ncbi:hypothetical protein CATMIT_01790, partial [Catenibacterium mitsuokai DSM 15897]
RQMAVAVRRGCGGAALFDALPDLLVQVEGHGIAGRLDQGQRAADPDAAGHQIADQEGDGEVDAGEAEGLAHGAGLK